MITLLRFSCLVWPSLLLVLLVIFLRPSARSVGAALVASLWNLSALLALHPLAYSMRWWTYEAEHGLILGMPADLLLGWALLWGAIPILLFRRYPLWHPLVLCFLLDLLLMPACTPLIKLGPYWLVGELTVLVISLYPGLVLGLICHTYVYFRAVFEQLGTCLETTDVFVQFHSDLRSSCCHTCAQCRAGIL